MRGQRSSITSRSTYRCCRSHIGDGGGIGCAPRTCVRTASLLDPNSHLIDYSDMADAKPIPANSSPLIPAVVLPRCGGEIDFCVRGPGATELGRRQGQDGMTLLA